MNGPDYKKIGKRIRAVRLTRKMSQNTLASLAEISEPYISNIENGKANVSLEVLFRICLALETSMDHILALEYPVRDAPICQVIMLEVQKMEPEMQERALRVLRAL